MVNRKTASALTVAALLACAIPAKSITSTSLSLAISPVIGQATPTFSIPDSVAEGTEVVISSSSDNMNAISEALGTAFEGEYNNSKVSIESKDANAAIQDVLNGNADLAAISRPLTVEEKAKGLISVPVRREKIAIVVDKDNPFSQSLTGSQFAQIFRGEIKDWAAVGGQPGPIKLVDRPANSETRQSLSPYPVFTTAPFKAAEGATTLEADTTEAVVGALGTEGISYVLVGELEGQPELKALQLHKTLPSDPKYPFSQPYAFVYAVSASPEASAFLGFATGNPGQAAVNNAGVSGVGLIPDAGGGTAAANTNTADTNTASDENANNAASEDGTDETPEDNADASAEGNPEGNTTAASDVTVAGLDGELGTEDDLNIAGPDSVLGTADDIRGVGPDGEIGTADDVDLAGPDGLPGTADDVNLAGPDGEIGTADDIAFASAAGEGSGVGDRTGDSGAGNLASNGKWWWLLVPLAGLGLLIWAAGRRSSEEETGYIANAEGDDRIRSAFDEGASASISGRNIGTEGLETNTDGTEVGGKGIGLGKVAASGAAIAGGAAAAGAGLAGRMKDKAGDVAMDLQEGVSGSVTGGVDGINNSIDGVQDSVQGKVQGSIDSLKGGVQGSIDGVKDSLQGSSEGVKGSMQSGISGLKEGIQSGVDNIKDVGAAGVGAGAAGLDSVGAGLSGLRDKAQGGIDGVKEDVDSVKGATSDAQSAVQSTGSSWLDRAKARINEATEQVQDTASNLKDDVAGND